MYGCTTEGLVLAQAQLAAEPPVPRRAVLLAVHLLSRESGESRGSVGTKRLPCSRHFASLQGELCPRLLGGPYPMQQDWGRWEISGEV